MVFKDFQRNRRIQPTKHRPKLCRNAIHRPVGYGAALGARRRHDRFGTAQRFDDLGRIHHDKLPEYLASRKMFVLNYGGDDRPLLRQILDMAILTATHPPHSTRKRAKKPPSEMQAMLVKRLQAVQAELKLTHEQMARRLGVGRTTWTNWLNSENKPEEEAMVRLCEFARVTMEWLYRGIPNTMEASHYIRLTARVEGDDPDRVSPRRTAGRVKSRELTPAQE